MCRAYWFPDNTVFCNFGCADALADLERILDGRGRWTEAVEYEAARSARYIPSLTSLDDATWLSEPIEISSHADIQAVDRIRRLVFGGAADQPLQHLGEAQTSFVILQRPEFTGSTWITDDYDALEWGRRNSIRSLTTVDLLREGVSRTDITGERGLAIATKIDEERGLRDCPRRVTDLM